MKMKSFYTLALALLLSVPSFAQLKTPQPSPTATISQAVGLTDIEITYSRPGKKDREIFGNLVPFGKIWRTGANKATAFTTSDDIKMGGKEVPAGTYALFTIPGEKTWTIIVHKNTELWGTGDYKQEDDLVRFDVPAVQMSATVETFTIDWSGFTNQGANLMLVWDNTMVAIPVETNTDEVVMKQIKGMLIEPDARTYAAAANYYHAEKKDMEMAVKWMDTAIEKRPEAFWYIHAKAKMLRDMGKTKEAIATAEKSLEMAKASERGDFGYIANNEKLLAELKK